MWNFLAFLTLQYYFIRWIRKENGSKYIKRHAEPGICKFQMDLKMMSIVLITASWLLTLVCTIRRREYALLIQHYAYLANSKVSEANQKELILY